MASQSPPDDPWFVADGCQNPSEPALTVEIIPHVQPLDDQFGVRPKKSVPHVLDDLLFGPSPTPLYSYAILDGARVVNLPDLLAGSGLPHRCLYLDKDDTGLGDLAPWIVQLDRLDPFTRHLFTQGDAPWELWDRQPGIFIRSTAPIDALWRHFRRFTRLYSDRTESWHYFRFYQPQIARTVVASFDRAQFQRFGAPLALIACPARDGGFCVMRPRPEMAMA